MESPEKTKDAPWYENNLKRMMTGWCFPDFDQLYPESCDQDWAVVQKLVNEKLDAPAMAARLAEIGTDVFYFHAKSCGPGNLWYNSATGHKHSALGDRDWVGELVQACRDKGIIPVCMVQVTLDKRVHTEHPEWRQLKADGTAAERGYPCINSPYRAQVLRELGEIVSGYDIGGDPA